MTYSAIDLPGADPLHRSTIRTRLATAAPLAPLALGLVARGDDDADDAPTSTSSGTSHDSGTSDDSGTTPLQSDVESTQISGSKFPNRDTASTRHEPVDDLSVLRDHNVSRSVPGSPTGSLPI